MYSSQSKVESERVSRRVQQSKKEIEQLKLELQKLINGGVNIHESNANIATNDNTKEQKPTNAPAKYIARKIPTLNNISTKSKDLQEHKVEHSPKKVRHYDVNETREYMRKQKQKRSLMIQSQIKNSQVNIDLKNQKLKELQMKSLQLVQKNVKRSKSRENASKIITKKIADEEIVDPKFAPDDSIKGVNVKRNVSNCDNITIRDRDCDLDVIPTLEPSVSFNSYGVKHAAAVKIQALFRGYRQRKLNKLRPSTKATDESVKKSVKELVADIEKSVAIESPKEPVKVKETIPFWLQPVVQPYPYNFITAVKRKLNLAVSAPLKISSDVGVQTPLSEAIPHHAAEAKFDSTSSLKIGRRTNDNTINCDRKTRDKSKHSKSASRSRHFSSGSDTSRDIPDISSESVSKCKSDPDVCAVSLALDGLTINVDKLKNLKLREKSLENVCFDRPKSKTFLQVPEISLAIDKSSKLRQCDDAVSCNFNDYSKSSPKSKKSKSYEKNDICIITSNVSPLSKAYQDKLNGEKSYHSTVSSESAKSNSSNIDDDMRSKVSKLFKSLLTKSPNTTKSKDISEERTKVDSGNSEQYTCNFSSAVLSTPTVPSLKRPTVTLKPRQYNLPAGQGEIYIKPGETASFESKNTNQIHLKFEAELHFLNDFNQSLQQIMAIEKSLVELQAKSANTTTVYQHQDTQTSIYSVDNGTKPESARETEPVSDVSKNITDVSKNITDVSKNITVRNYSRQSEIEDNLRLLSLDTTSDKSFRTTCFEMSQFNESVDSTINNSKFNSFVQNSSFGGNVYAGLSLGMFDQLIKDEDTRIENLKTILKIREKALLDRTKGELMWFEIQRKHLIETGQLQEASVIKKKQRGTLIKLQHEKQEMQRLRQMQKSSSKERKTVLKEQQNKIKAQLSNNNAPTKIRRSRPKERLSGPMKVYNLHQETINADTTVSRKTSDTDEIGTNESFIEDRCTDVESLSRSAAMRQIFSQSAETTKRTLLMREASLQKRRKAAEGLLQWHQRLLEEERKIVELEMVANSVINQVPSLTVDKPNKSTNKYTFTGSQLNSLWLNMTGSEECRFNDAETYLLSQVALERFCKVARVCAGKNKHFLMNCSDLNDLIRSCISDVDSNNSIRTVSKSSSATIKEFVEKSNDYTSEFESPEVDEVNSVNVGSKSPQANLLENEFDKSKSTLHEIMQNISNISDEISAIYKLSSVVCVKADAVEDQTHHVNDVSEAICSEKSETAQSEIVKSLSELIKTQSPCQDASSLSSETPEHSNNRNNDSVESSHASFADIENKSSDHKRDEISTRFEIENNQENVVAHEISLRDKNSNLAIKEISNDDRTIQSDMSDFNDSIENKINDEDLNSCNDKLITSEINSSVVDDESNHTEQINTSEPLSEERNNNSVNSRKSIDEKSVEIIKTQEIYQLNERNDSKESVANVSDDSTRENVNCEVSNNIEREIVSDKTLTKALNEIETNSALETELEVDSSSRTEISEELVNDNVVEDAKVDVEIKDGASNSFNVEKSEILADVSVLREDKSHDIYTTTYDVATTDQSPEIGSLDNDVISVTQSYGEEDELSKKELVIEQEVKQAKINVEMKDDKNNSVNVKKRVSEILADASTLREDKSPRLQDIYTTTYDVSTPEQLPEIGSPDSHDVISVTQLYGEEAELFKKQLAIEQEIKQLELQQKEQIPYLYMREIPNKPPPPYTPPVTQVVNSVLPFNSEQIETIIYDITDTIYESYKNGTLESLSAQPDVNHVDKDCYLFVFDLSKELAMEHHRQLIDDDKPSWMRLNKSLLKAKPLNKSQLKNMLCKKTKEVIGFERTNHKKSNEAKWSRKKRDHVDDLLVLESQAEESEWTNYDDDEVIVRNDLTNDIMNMLLAETADVMSKIFSKRNTS